MKNPNHLNNEDEKTRNEQLSHDTLRDLVFSGKILEVLDCLLIEPLYNMGIQRNVKTNIDLKERKDSKGIDHQTLSAHLKLLLINGIITRVLIDPAKIRLGYAMTDYGLNLITIYMPLMLWAINHRKKMIGKEDK